LQNEATTAPKRDKILPKNRSLLVHIVELSTAVAKVDIKVINASLTQNQCFYNFACWDTATTRRHWTEQWRHDQVGPRPLPNKTKFINFLKEI